MRIHVCQRKRRVVTQAAQVSEPPSYWGRAVFAFEKRTEGTQTSQTCAAEPGMNGAGSAAKKARMVAATSCGPASAGTGCPRSSASRTCLHRTHQVSLGRSTAHRT